MKTHHLSVTKAAQLLDVDPNILSEILKGKADITSEIAEKISIEFGVASKLWLTMQLNYNDQEEQKRAAQKTNP